MNKLEELENKINELASEIETLKAEKENESWKPKDGEWYWFISHSGGGIPVVWHGDAVDERRYAIGNVFRTKEEAEFRVEQLKVEAELRRFSRPFEENKDNWVIVRDLDDKKLLLCRHSGHQTANVYFEKPVDAKKAIEAIGEERIKKYYFGINE